MNCSFYQKNGVNDVGSSILDALEKKDEMCVFHHRCLVSLICSFSMNLLYILGEDPACVKYVRCCGMEDVVSTKSLIRYHRGVP